ncbi:hypothetical protein BCR43DRAFT_493622 [Syncephalastrum racemosum]|uniref:Uncharacterized protein n=1 Tax=Syncephalastrum racemosum TaxID=13706 RepID=A0A1X2HAV9_SYNRA|nr:hypothetical protein BCR43DRAFT_493622 [Syncephalastrum racemosum]
MPVATASSSKSGFPRTQRHDTVLDVLLPRFYEYDMMSDQDHDSNFRRSPGSDPELAVEDDALYAETLLNSDFAAWLKTDEDNPSSSTSCSTTSLERLRMLVAHIGQSLQPTPTLLSLPPSSAPTNFRSVSQQPSPSSSSSSSPSSASPSIPVHTPRQVDMKGKKKSRQSSWFP